MQYVNSALISKLIWKLLVNPDTLWARILLAKYQHDLPLLTQPKCPVSASVTWRSIIKTLPLFRKGLGWRLGNGQQIDFWRDTWLTNRPLVTLLPSVNVNTTDSLLVSDFISAGGAWDMDQLARVVPASFCNRIRTLLITDQPDHYTWLCSSDGRFSTASAYRLFNGINDNISMVQSASNPSYRQAWKEVWRVPCHERVRFFLWRLTQNGIPTKVNLANRHIAVSSVCPLCGLAAEDLLHRLRDCMFSRTTWDSLYPLLMVPSFYTLDFIDWLNANLTIQAAHPYFHVKWCALFGYVVWSLWLERNRCAFHHPILSPKNMAFRALSLTKEFIAEQRVFSAGSMTISPKKTVYIGWEFPPVGFVKLNTDGSSSSSGDASAAGLLRDHNGHWVGGFYQHLGDTSPLGAELWGLLTGLCLAWSLRLPRIIIETDSLLAVKLLQGTVSPSHRFYSLIYAIKAFLRLPWEFHLRHQHREGNRAADWMANMASLQPYGVHILQAPPIGLVPLLNDDISGVSFPRSCRTSVGQ